MPRNKAPIITSADTATVDVGQTFIIDVDATDQNRNDVLMYTVDNALFDIASDTGILTFDSPPAYDYDDPANNIYSVVVTVSDGEIDVTQTITITVEPPVGNAAPTIDSANSATVEEGQSFVIDVDSSDDSSSEGDGLGYVIAGGADAGLFTIDENTGVLSFIGSAPAYIEDGDNSYAVEVTVADFEGETDTQVITVHVTQVIPNVAPSFDSDPLASVSENQTFAIDVQASDDSNGEGAGLTYSIVGGLDQSLFTIDENTGVLSFNDAPDFENPGDFGSDNNYEVTVQVVDSESASATQAITITVDDIVDESGPNPINGFAAASDNLIGTAGVDIISGLEENSTASGAGTIDTLAGGGGGDTFILGTDTTRYYDDGNDRSKNNGKNDYALITDFGDGADTIQLHDSGYIFADYSVNGATGVGIFYESPRGGDGFDSRDELIGLIEGVSLNEFENSGDYEISTPGGLTIVRYLGAVNSPASFGGATGGNGVEDGADITGVLSVTDPDGITTENFAIAPGGQAANGTASIDNAGNWSYTPNLNFNGPDSFTVAVVDDDGNTETQVISITVDPVNDAATIGGTMTGDVFEDGVLAFTGSLNVTDPDAGENELQPVTAGTAGDNAYGTFEVLANGSWTYTLNNSDAAVQALGDGDTLTDTIDVLSEDGSAGETLTMTITGANDLAVIDGASEGGVTEDSVLSANGVLNVTDPDAGEDGVVAQSSTTGTYGWFSVDASGNWTYDLDNDGAVQSLGASDSVAETFTVTSIDGSDDEDVVITVYGADETVTPTVVSHFSADEGGIVSSGGDFTNDTSPIVHGTAAPGASVTVFVNGVPAGGTTADAVDGTWALELGVQADGTYDITARVGSDPLSNTVAITIKENPPATPIIFSMDQDSGVSSTDYLTNDANPNFTGTADANVDISVFFDDGGTIIEKTTTSDVNGDWTLVWSGGDLVDGAYTVTTQATDPLARSSTPSVGFTLTIDTMGPENLAVLAIHDEDDSAQQGDETNDQTPDISGKAEAGQLVEIWLNGTDMLGTAVADINGDWYYEWDHPTIVLEDDSTHFVTIRATDDAGNFAESASASFTVNTPTLAAPVITGWGDDNGHFPDDGVTNDALISMSGTSIANATIEIYIGEVLQGTTTADGNGNWSFVDGELNLVPQIDATWTYHAVARIGDDYSLDSESVTITFDFGDPTGTTVTGATRADDIFYNSGDSDDLTPDLRGQAEAGSRVYVYIDGSLLGTTITDQSGLWVWNWTDSPLTDGASYTVTAIAEDLAGNTSTTSADFLLTIDTTPEPPVSETFEPTDDLYPAQWHFDNLGDIERIWAEYTGDGVNVAVYDNGVQSSHHQLDDNYNFSLDFGLSTPANGNHGTAVAGIIAAEADGSGTVGIAFDAGLTGVNIISGNTSANAADRSNFYDALDHMKNFDVVNHSWGWGPGFGSGANPAARADTVDFYANAIPEFEAAAAEGRGGLGTILVKSAGNGPLAPLAGPVVSAQDDTLNTIHETIVVGAVALDGELPYYSARGANLLVSAPSEGNQFTSDIPVTTTDVTGIGGYVVGDYTDFGGTSAAAPMVSGVVALMLEANPNLGWRDVQNILAYSASHTGTSIGGSPALFSDERNDWFFNGADNWNGGGLHFSQDYGYGEVDVYNAVRMAEVWSLFDDPLTTANILSTSKTGTLTLNSGTGLGFGFNMNLESDKVVEYVEVTVTSADPIANIWMTSVENTSATLYTAISGDSSVNDYPGDLPSLDWTFGANAFRGEDGDGIWWVYVDQLDLGTSVTVTLDITYVTDTVDDVYHYTDEIFADIMDGTPSAISDDASRTTLNDAGGVDWLNMAAMTDNLDVDLTSGATSTANGEIFLTIDSATDIENAIGGDGNDFLAGNALDNTLMGMRGDDILFAGAGSNTLEGGAGADIFVWDDGFGMDVVVNWDSEFDLLNFASFSEVDTTSQLIAYTDFLASADEVNGDVIYDLGDNSLNKITFEDVTLAEFSEANFDLDTTLIA